MSFAPLPFTLRQLQYALAVAGTRNFRRAADQCAVAQPSLSAQLAALEASLGVPIFERGRGGVRPTPAGEALLARMRRLVADGAALEREARAFQDPLAGTLRLGVIPTLAPYLLPLAAPILQAAFPRLKLLWTEARTADIAAALEEGALEGGLLALEADLDGLETLPLGRDPFLVCLPRGHRLARGRGPLAIGDLEGECLLLLEDGHCLRHQALAACGRTKVEELGFRATSLPTLVQMVGGGAGITLLPRLSTALEAPRAPVVLRALKPPVPFRTLGLAWRRGSYAEGALRALGGELGSKLAPHLD